jgi:hypothetical protein
MKSTKKKKPHYGKPETLHDMMRFLLLSQTFALHTIQQTDVNFSS